VRGFSILLTYWTRYYDDDDGINQCVCLELDSFLIRNDNELLIQVCVGYKSSCNLFSRFVYL